MSLQTKVVYMKFPKNPCCWWLEQCAFYPNFAPPAALQANIFFWRLACGLHLIINRQMKCKTFVIFKYFQRVLYYTPHLFKYFRLGQSTSSIFRIQQASEIIIVFKHFFPKRFSIKFCIWKSNGVFSLHWASPLKMAQSQSKRYESEKITLKLE